MKYIKKLFGGIELTWLKLMIFAIISGVYTGAVLVVPVLADTSFTDIGATFECWIFFAIIIITNCKKPLESAVKTFVFFLISQPLVYLVQVPFYWRGWEIFSYYPPWFLWTLLTFPMAFIGWFIKKDKWYSLLILSPMLVLLAELGMSYLHSALYMFPRHLLTAIFCAVQIFLFIFALFEDIRLRIAGCIIGAALLTVFFFMNVYHKPYITGNLWNSEIGHETLYTVESGDESIAKAYTEPDEYGSGYNIWIEYYKTGSTDITLTDEAGNVLVYEVTFGKNYYRDVVLKDSIQAKE